MSKVTGRFGFLRRLALWVIAIATIARGLPAEEIATGFQERVYRDETGNHKYTVFVPAAYTPQTKWPVLLFLHGAAERGTDNKLPLVGGIGPQVKARAATFPFIVVFPQCEDLDCPARDGWRSDGADAKRALKILDAVEQELSVDRRREVLTGLSMGGFGVWGIAAATPSRWSAIVPVAGLGELSQAVNLKNTPVWAFQGSRDRTVQPVEHQRMVDAVREAGGRAYLTLIPNVRHNVLHFVYDDDALYEWMLDPKSEPRPESFIRNAKRPHHKSEMERDFLPEFVPGVEIPQAVYMHLDPEAIEAVAEALPDLVPAEALSAAGANIYDTRPGIFSRFHIALSGISYRGGLERVIVTAKDGGWITIAVGMRNVVAEICSTEIHNRMIAASAGPMDIVIGEQRPVWLTFDVRPSIVERQVKFEVGARHFEIPNDDFYVTTPQVAARGVPFIRSRISNTVSSQLVNGAYGRKSDIEGRVLEAVPGMVQRLEQAIDKTLSETRVIEAWPIPALLPRYRMWPDSLQVDHSGISVILGAVIAQPGLHTTPRPVRRIEHETVRLDAVPPHRGFTLGLSGAVIEGLSAAMVDVGVAEFKPSDLSVREFGAFDQIDAMVKAVPDLARYGDQLRIRTRLRAIEPVSFRVMSEPQSTLRGRSLDASPTYLQLGIPRLALYVDIKTSPNQSKWQTCAEFELRMTQDLRACVRKPSFSERTFSLNRSAPGQIAATGRFVEGYAAVDGAIHPEAVAEIFRTGWTACGKIDLLEGIAMKDQAIGKANLRLADLDQVGHFMTLRYLPATTRITNALAEPLVYKVRGRHSELGGPYTLQPRQSHDFSVPYPLTVQRLVRDQEVIQALPMGTHFVFGVDEKARTSNVASEGGAEATRK
jgi:poly(3-hydroxybutyrate) depolymerase